jgi:aminomethyltransferase
MSADGTQDQQARLSPLDAAHRELGARMAPFAGWSMPIQFAGVMPEHQAVRESNGVFDISHMGQIWIEGEPGVVGGWLNMLLCNDVSVLAPGEGQYSLMLNDEGGVIDDLLVYRTAIGQFLLVVNAARVAEDMAQLESLRMEGVSINNVSEECAAIAVQGPGSAETFAKMAEAAGIAGFELPKRNGIHCFDNGVGKFELCRTGYTGEDGFELFCPANRIDTWWRRAIEAGAVPCGLGARDTLRLEKCYPLNGSDLDGQHTPLEAGLGFFVALDKPDFVGYAALREQKESGLKQRLVAIQMTVKGPPLRPGYGVHSANGEAVLAVLTSGTLSPTLGLGIGLAYLPIEQAKLGTKLEIDIRGRRFAAEVVKKPFVKGAA